MYIDVPYLYPSSTHYLYILYDCELPTAWVNKEVFGHIEIDNLKNFIQYNINTEPVIRDSDCDQCTGSDVFRENVAKLSGIRTQDIYSLTDTLYYINNHESEIHYLPSKYMKLRSTFDLKKTARGFMKAQIHIDSNTASGIVLFRIINKYSNNYEVQMTLIYEDGWIKYHWVRPDSPGNTGTFNILQPELQYTNEYQFLFSWDSQYMGDSDRSLKIYYRSYSTLG